MWKIARSCSTLAFYDLWENSLGIYDTEIRNILDDTEIRNKFEDTEIRNKFDDTEIRNKFDDKNCVWNMSEKNGLLLDQDRTIKKNNIEAYI